MRQVVLCACGQDLTKVISWHYIDDSNRSISNSPAMCVPCYAARYMHESPGFDALFSADAMGFLAFDQGVFPRGRFFIVTTKLGTVLYQ